MTKSFAAILCVLLGLSLFACTASQPSVYRAQRDGKEYVVDTVSKKISDGTHTYRYSLDGDSGGYSIKITYPDGSTYWWRTQSSGFGVGYGGWSDDYDENRYVNGDILCDILEDAVPAGTVIFGDLKSYKFNWAKEPTVTADTSVGFRSGSTVWRVMGLADGKVAQPKGFAVYTRA